MNVDLTEFRKAWERLMQGKTKEQEQQPHA